MIDKKSRMMNFWNWEAVFDWSRHVTDWVTLSLVGGRVLYFVRNALSISTIAQTSSKMNVVPISLIAALMHLAAFQANTRRWPNVGN